MSPLRRFLIDSKSQWGWLALLILALITAAMFEVSAPVLLGKVVDAIISGLQTKTLIPYSPLLIQSSSGLLPSMEVMLYSHTSANT